MLPVFAIWMHRKGKTGHGCSQVMSWAEPRAPVFGSQMQTLWGACGGDPRPFRPAPQQTDPWGGSATEGRTSLALGHREADTGMEGMS